MSFKTRPTPVTFQKPVKPTDGKIPPGPKSSPDGEEYDSTEEKCKCINSDNLYGTCVSNPQLAVCVSGDCVCKDNAYFYNEKCVCKDNYYNVNNLFCSDFIPDFSISIEEGGQIVYKCVDNAELTEDRKNPCKCKNDYTIYSFKNLWCIDTSKDKDLSSAFIKKTSNGYECIENTTVSKVKPKCICDDNSVLEGTTCIKKCFGENIILNRETNKCECLSDQYKLFEGNRCVEKQPEFTKFDNNEYKCIDHAEMVDNQCTCEKKYLPFGSFCIDNETSTVDNNIHFDDDNEEKVFYCDEYNIAIPTVKWKGKIEIIYCDCGSNSAWFYDKCVDDQPDLTKYNKKLNSFECVEHAEYAITECKCKNDYKAIGNSCFVCGKNQEMDEYGSCHCKSGYRNVNTTGGLVCQIECPYGSVAGIPGTNVDELEETGSSSSETVEEITRNEEDQSRKSDNQNEKEEYPLEDYVCICKKDFEETVVNGQKVCRYKCGENEVTDFSNSKCYCDWNSDTVEVYNDDGRREYKCVARGFASMERIIFFIFLILLFV